MLVSLGCHAVVGFLLLHTRNPLPARPDEPIEVMVTEPAPSEGGTLGVGRVPVSTSSPNQAKPAHGRRAVGTVRAEGRAVHPGEPSAPPAAPIQPAEGPPSAPGEVNRLATLLPAHPDLSGAGRLGETGGQRRDLLAPPGSRAPVAPPSELPKVLRGGGGVTAEVAEDGAIRFHDAKNLSYNARTWSGRFDLTDAIMRKAGQDPYAAVKRKLADDTHEQRICMAKQAQQKRQSEALLGLSARVKQVAGRIDLSPLARRQIVFEIWDECLEGPEDAGLDYGRMARAIILAAIRESFPPGSELAYQPAEIVALNQRRSSQEKFAPYESRTAKPRWGRGGTTGASSP